MGFGSSGSLRGGSGKRADSAGASKIFGEYAGSHREVSGVF